MIKILDYSATLVKVEKKKKSEIIDKIENISTVSSNESIHITSSDENITFDDSDDYIITDVTNWKYNSIWNFNQFFHIFLNKMSLNYFPNSLNFFQNNFKQKWYIDDFDLVQHDNFFIIENADDYLFSSRSSFISFFTINMIDVPICFKKSKSLKNKNFEFFFLKFSNLLMLKGKKEQIFRHLLNSFFKFFYDIQIDNFKKFKVDISWFELHCFLNKEVKFSPFNEPTNFFFDEIKLLNNNSFDFFFKNFDINFFVKNFIQEKFSQLSPLFLYFTYNVDKNIRKYTRGKSGRYVFVWKYVAPYKRKYLMLRWFLKEMKFDESRKFETRIKNMLSLVIFNLNDTYAWKAKNYTYALIFKNLRKTLMMNFKTTKKQ